MNSSCISPRHQSVRETVETICTLIESNLSKQRPQRQTERQYRQEIMACLLSSQVRFETANAALERIERRGLMSHARWNASDDHFEAEVTVALQDSETPVKERSGYRFPKIRARQIAAMREVLQRRPLAERLGAATDIKQLRAELVHELPGIGPKQASMFLRNVGFSYDIAILDKHVLDFFREAGSLEVSTSAVSNMRAYERAEMVVSEYAADIGYRVGLLDWAIWITMRAAKELRL